MLVDEAPIRECAVQAYHALEEQVAAIRRSLDAYEEGDLPAYHRWEAATLGPLLTELREVTEELEQKRHLLIMVEDEVFWTGCTRTKAYQRVLKELKNPKANAREQEPYEDDSDEAAAMEGMGIFGESDLPPGMTAKDYDRMSAREKRDFREYYDGMADIFEIFTGEVAPDLDEVLRRSRRGGGKGEPESKTRGESRQVPPPSAAQPPRQETRLKDLYRELVRKLHPDKGGEQTPRERELWHHLQEAYRQNDLAAMEAIAGRLEVSLNGGGRYLPVQILLRMAQDLREVLAGMQAQVRKAKAQPGWNFRSRGAKLEKIAATRQRKLRQEIAEARAELTVCRREVEILAQKAEATEAKQKAREAKKRPARVQEEFPF